MMVVGIFSVSLMISQNSFVDTYYLKITGSQKIWFSIEYISNADGEKVNLIRFDIQLSCNAFNEEYDDHCIKHEIAVRCQ